MVSDLEICVAEKRVDDKTGELTVLPSVIASLCIVGALVSVDAMGTHRNIARQIIMQGGDYLMALKDNLPILRDLVRLYSTTQPQSPHTPQRRKAMAVRRNANVLFWIQSFLCRTHT